jgi:hypothetical protein
MLPILSFIRKSSFQVRVAYPTFEMMFLHRAEYLKATFQTETNNFRVADRASTRCESEFASFTVAQMENKIACQSGTNHKGRH